ncbi:hypothetical protein EDC96DRAFT_565830 [Choanephora cucurbitarum]|nr:hypothetical protein EDC96DRAFT_565830 [Choanephora cucurbitarum]
MPYVFYTLWLYLRTILYVIRGSKCFSHLIIIIWYTKKVSNKNSVVKAIVNVIPSEEYEESILDYYSMKETFSMYFVDFKSIRARRSRFRRKLDQLSSRLLRIGFGSE